MPVDKRLPDGEPEEVRMADEGPRTLWAKVTDDGAVWDRDPSQIDGEVWISGPEPVQCRATTRINEAIAAHRLVEVPNPNEPAKPAGKA